MTLRWIDLLNRIQKMDEFEIDKPVAFMDGEQFITPVTNIVSLTDDITITSNEETIELKTGDVCLGGDIW